ncbi:hypothetical protein ES703_82287 [subsurface metagenome]
MFPKGTTLDWAWASIDPEDMAGVEVGDLKTPTKALPMDGQKITGLGTPAAGEDAATKDYIDSLVQGLDWQQSVLDEMATPPGSPTTGDRYLVIATATDEWVGHEDDIAEWEGSEWEFTTPDEGFAVWIEDVGKQKVYNGSAWVAFGTTVDHGNLTGLGDDDHSQYLNNARHDVTDRHSLGAVVPHDALASLTEKAHSSLTGIANDDHTQYLNTTRHDVLARHPLGTAVPHDNLADLAEKAHGSLSGIGESDHHAKTADYEVFGLTEEVTGLPAAAVGNLGRFMRERTGAGEVTRIHICMQNSANGYEWVQVGIST